ncbi:GAF domain-containing protein [Mycobacterium asiaticum]|uniref:GAF domain-containing protein n=1 Tax=Mycobacterium asiaticum TaxID=1790 RepID=UPI001561A224|nr:GAF domain-containing protein [Mycobacterium asiaticum]
MPGVYRAPMRSRSDAVDSRGTLDRALLLGLCGFGQLVDKAGAVDRLERRVARFADVADGSFVWTRDPDGLYWLGRIAGPYFFDDDDDAVAVDLVHVRHCEWRSEPLLEPGVPAAVVATFRRGGRNFQQTHHPSVSQETQRIWDL